MISDADVSLVICVSLQKMSMQVFWSFFNQVFFFVVVVLMLTCVSSLYILDINLLWIYHLQISSPIQ